MVNAEVFEVSFLSIFSISERSFVKLIVGPGLNDQVEKALRHNYTPFNGIPEV
jgi:hypothetical protein